MNSIIISAVEKEVDKYLCKFSHFKETSSINIDSMINDLYVIQKVVDDTEGSLIDGALLERVAFLVRAINETVTKIGTDHREIHSTISRLGKVIDKNFTHDFSPICNEKFLNKSNKENLNKIICQHFIREGLIGTSEIFMKEAQFEEKTDTAIFFQISSIAEALKNHDLQPALDWVEQNKIKLKEQKSSLDFKLYQLGYLKLLQEQPGSINEVVQYAKTHFSPFVEFNEKTIQSLLGCLLYASSGLEESPYKKHLRKEIWIEISESFMKEACMLYGLSVRSPLAMSIAAGITALPILMNIKQVMGKPHVNPIWDSKDELPVEINLGTEFHFHSIFACPILRQQCTTTNPPIKLVCGHVISKDAVTKLTRENSYVKCPYCHNDQNVKGATVIHF